MLIPYTICFCLRSEQVLMLYRSKPPNAHHWNGLGGKIEAGETPLESVRREILEEAEIDLDQAQDLRYAGLVTWADGNDLAPISGGMYTFLASFAADFVIWPDRHTPEGLLSWKPLDWVCQASNPDVVSNISLFLPRMLNIQRPQEYRCYYQKSLLQKMITRPLPPALSEISS